MWVKICGVTTVDDAVACVLAGADAIGVNLVASSPRCVDAERAREIARAVAERASVIGIVANASDEAMRALLMQSELTLLQLHGDETPKALAGLLPLAYKAVRIGTREDAVLAARYGGDTLLVDAKVEGALGGTGATFDWSLVADLARARKIILAGGLNPENVEAAARAVKPYGVDVASGVEKKSDPRAKDLDRVRAFIERAKGA